VNPVPDIEFFFWEGCPSHERALADLYVAMVELEIDIDLLTVTKIVDEADAEVNSFPGSPTVRVRGVDVQDPGDNPIGLTCRLYRRRDGRASPLPDPADLRDALATIVAPDNSAPASAADLREVNE